MTGRNSARYAGHAGGSVACPDCGKVRYPSRTAARQAARHAAHLRGLNAYRCGEFWHLGHLPDDVRHGKRTRGDLVP